MKKNKSICGLPDIEWTLMEALRCPKNSYQEERKSKIWTLEDGYMKLFTPKQKLDR